MRRPKQQELKKLNPVVPGVFLAPSKPARPGLPKAWLNSFGHYHASESQLPVPLGFRIHKTDRDWQFVKPVLVDALGLGYEIHVNFSDPNEVDDFVINEILSMHPDAIFSIGNSTKVGDAVKLWKADYSDTPSMHFEIQDDSGVRGAAYNAGVVPNKIISFHAYSDQGFHSWRHLKLLKEIYPKTEFRIMELNIGFPNNETPVQDRPDLLGFEQGVYVRSMVEDAAILGMPCCIFYDRMYDIKFELSTMRQESLVGLTQGLYGFDSPISEGKLIRAKYDPSTKQVRKYAKGMVYQASRAMEERGTKYGL